ncbi:MAG: hypothetical protein ACK4TA_01065 [Saprospiraceae bacterium]
MKVITEDIVDQIVERFDDSDAAYEQAVETMEAEQPVLMGYLFSEEFEAFTQDEKEYLLLLATIIWQAVKESNGNVPQVSEKALADAEEQNWSKLEGVTAQRFHERLDVFFDEYPQEDLLAFVEDALVDDEEDPIVTKEAREAMFITLKTVIDTLTQG